MVTLTSETGLSSRPIVSGGLLVLLAAVGFSAKAVLVKLAYAYSPQLDAITLMSLRSLLVCGFELFLADRLEGIQGHPGGLRHGRGDRVVYGNADEDKDFRSGDGCVVCDQAAAGYGDE